MLRLTDSALTLTGPGLALLQFGSETGSPSMLQGVGLVASGSTLDIQGAVMSLAGVTLLDTLPQLQLAATTVTQTGASSFINVNGPPSQVPGSLMNATNSTVSTTGSLLQIQETTLTMASSSANNAEGGISLVRLDQSLVNAGDFFAEISGALVLNGSLVQATDSILATAGDFIMLRRGGTLSSAGAQALVQLTDSSLRAFTLLVNDGGSVDLVGTSLLNAVNSQLTFDFAVVQSPFGGQITSATTAPLIALDGGTLSSEGHLFVLSGNVFSPSPNTVAPPQTGGTLLAGTNGAIINIAGQALRLDTALLQASLPILHLIGAPTQETVLTSGSSTVDLVKSTMTGLGPVVALDRSIINVTNGPLIRLANGSVMLVNGDLLQLLNGSRINVVNGPLILVAGNGSLLNVSGALVFFGGTGGNQIVVNNSIAPTATMSGIPVSASSGGAVSIGPAPVTNPHLGSITIGSGGSAIQATDGCVVTNAVPGGPTN